MITCKTCPKRSSCVSLCDAISNILPSNDLPEAHRIPDTAALSDIVHKRIETTIILDHLDDESLPEHYQRIGRMYYREGKTQTTIARCLGTTQQNINTAIKRMRKRIGKIAMGR
jgi:DNA-directed RNA polymerase specialized sigma subunit